MRHFVSKQFFATVGLASLGLPFCAASDILSVSPLTDRIVLIHLKDGKVNYHKRGQKRGDDVVITDPLDIYEAVQRINYRLSSASDANFRAGATPGKIWRKSKGTEYAWYVDKWENGRAINTRPDHVKEHWLYLTFPKPLTPGAIYTLNTGEVARNGKVWKFTYDLNQSTSEAVHTNLLGYAPASPAKFGYVFHWLGDGGALDLAGQPSRKFWLYDTATKARVFSGTVKLRKDRNTVETQHTNETPGGNFEGADVYECDFSTFSKPGNYRLAVEGVGASQPFKIEADAYREAFRVITRSLYHNRSGIALVQPYTEFTRPAPHNPLLTPGYKGKLKYTSVRWQDWGSEGGDKAKLEAGFKGSLDVSGWYQDAADWDGYPSHLRVAQELLLAFEIAPKNFSDGELNIPESKNGIPDIVDEAAWLPRFCYRLRKELLQKKYGTGGIGLRIAGDAFGGDESPQGTGQGSWEDLRTYAVSGEDAVSTFRYAGTAAQLAIALKLVGKPDPEGIDWQKEARESYAWARSHTPAKDEAEARTQRIYAAAALARLTGEPDYEAQLDRDTAGFGPDTRLSDDDQYGPLVFALGKVGSPALRARLGRVVTNIANHQVETAEKRALRWGGDFGMPMLVGQQTTPWVIATAVAWKVAAEGSPEAKRYLSTLYTTADFFLGCNSLNTTWATGLGPRHPKLVFHMDAWYNGKSGPHPGIVPYGIWRKDKEEGQGPWDWDWPNKTVYPNIDKWPGSERYFDIRTSPMRGEFTIHQNAAPSAAIYGILSGPKS